MNSVWKCETASDFASPIERFLGKLPQESTSLIQAACLSMARFGHWSHKDNAESVIRLAAVERLAANHGDKAKETQCCLLYVRINNYLLEKSPRNSIPRAAQSTTSKVGMIVPA